MFGLQTQVVQNIYSFSLFKFFCWQNTIFNSKDTQLWVNWVTSCLNEHHLAAVKSFPLAHTMPVIYGKSKLKVKWVLSLRKTIW